MKKITCFSLLTAILLLIASPALAGGNQTVWDIFDPSAGGGAILIWIGDDKLILISYTDLDASMNYSPGDRVERVEHLVAIPT